MNIPNTILKNKIQPHWCGRINEEDVEIHFDEEMSKLNSSNIYAVFSELGFHGWMEEGYDKFQVLWLVSGIAIPYEQALSEYKQIEQVRNGELQS